MVLLGSATLLSCLSHQKLINDMTMKQIGVFVEQWQFNKSTIITKRNLVSEFTLCFTY